LLPLHSPFWLGQSFLQMQRPIIAAITVTIAIAKFSELARRPGLVPGLSFLRGRFRLLWSVFEV
jgi:hypothetical protein